MIKAIKALGANVKRDEKLLVVTGTDSVLANVVKLLTGMGYPCVIYVFSFFEDNIPDYNAIAIFYDEEEPENKGFLVVKFDEDRLNNYMMEAMA